MKLYLIRGLLKSMSEEGHDPKGLVFSALSQLDELERLARIGLAVEKKAKNAEPIRKIERYVGDKRPIEFKITEKDIEKWIKEGDKR